MSSVPRLEFSGLAGGYGDVVVVRDIAGAVAAGEVLCVIGRNGVGKSTLLLTIMGMTRVHRGSISFRGKDISKVPAHKRARLGIGWVAQEREIFPSLSVEENLTVAARPGRWDLAAVYQLFPRLRERKGNMGNQLSGGEQQMLAIARALMSRPTLLLCDEPSLGLAPIVTQELFSIIARLNEEQGLSVLLVEQNASLALEIAHRVYLLETGSIVASGSSEQISSDDSIRKAYLGY
jgi:branched-chain amino acid transport system ATP-binding protein